MEFRNQRNWTGAKESDTNLVGDGCPTDPFSSASGADLLRSSARASRLGEEPNAGGGCTLRK